jgi:hypothetical protein
MNAMNVLTSPREHQVRALALRQFAERRATKPVAVDQSSLPAGTDMTFYCRGCGHICDVKAEEYIFPPYVHCSECRGLIAHGWLDPQDRT